MKLTLYFLLFSFLFFACNKQDEDTSSEGQFYKTYEIESDSSYYTPLDVVQKSNGDYLILAERLDEDINYPLVQLILTDDEGEVKSSAILSNTEVLACTKNILTVNDEYYLVSLLPTGAGSGLGTQIVKIADDLSVSRTASLSSSNFYYPLAASVDADGNIALLTVDESNTKFSVVDVNGSLQVNTITYSIATNTSFSLVSEASTFLQRDKTERQLPFMVGQMNSDFYYFNGYFNGELSTVFVDKSLAGTTVAATDATVSMLQGYADTENVNALLPINDTSFAVSFYNGDGTVFLSGQYDFYYQNSGTWTSVVNITTSPASELEQFTGLKIKMIGSKVVVGGNTFDGSIVLYGMNGENIGSRKYLGNGYQFKLANYTQTNDGGLFVLGEVNFSSTITRMVSFKLNSSSVKGL